WGSAPRARSDECSRQPALLRPAFCLSRCCGTGEWLLTLRPDFEWLTDPARVYPATVDPSTSWGASNRKSYKSDGVAQSGATWFGNPWQANKALYWRGFAQYPLSSIAGTYSRAAVLSVTYTTGTATCQDEYLGSGSSSPSSVSSYGSDIVWYG